MVKVRLVGRGLLHDTHTGTDASQSPTTGLRVSTDPQLFISKTLSTYHTWILLIVASTHLSMVSAQGNFSVQSTSYDCSSKMICLGKAHVYKANDSNGIEPGRLSLTQEDVPWTAGVAYYNQPIQLLDPSTRQSASFNTSFTIDKVQGIFNGSKIFGDGMAFVISADNSKIGSGGEYLGIFIKELNGITTSKSIIVEFDSWYNTVDISDNHVSFDFANISFAAAKNASDISIVLGDERTLYAWVEYSSQTQQLEVRVSNDNYRPTNALLNYNVNLSDVVDEYMWVGFSSSAGNSYSNYFIGDWTFESYGIEYATGNSTRNQMEKSSRGHLGLIVGISVGIPSFLVVCFVIALFVHQRSRGRDGSKICQLEWLRFNSEDPMLQIEGIPERFSYKQLSVATSAFSEDSKLGQGGFGSVYRGVLPSSGIPVAVKKIKGDSLQGEKEFMAEVSIISQIRHRNLIQLLGWCKDASRGKYLLVYDLMPNGSLDKVLFRPAEKTTCLCWEQRFNIVTGTASALDYLHHGWKRQVIHRDIKSSNIMLDENWNAKLGDFGLARLVDHQREAETTLVAGTYGYLAPEVVASAKFTEKTDVFSFGAVVLEVACGRRALASNLPENEVILVDWAWQKLSDGDLMSVVDKRLENYDTDRMRAMLVIGLLCSHPNPAERPSMGHVVQVFTGVAPVPSIPLSKPSFAIVSDRHTAFVDYVHSSKTRSISKSRSSSMSLRFQDNSATSQGSVASSFRTSSNSH